MARLRSTMALGSTIPTMIGSSWLPDLGLSQLVSVTSWETVSGSATPLTTSRATTAKHYTTTTNGGAVSSDISLTRLQIATDGEV